MTFPPNHAHDRETIVTREGHGSARGEALRNQKYIALAETDNALGLRAEPAL